MWFLFFFVYSFELFVKLFLMMAIAWLFLLLSWLRYDAVVYCHILINFLQAVVILYICVLGQRRVTFLLRQYCCCCCQPSEPVDTVDWGEEMSSMNACWKVLVSIHFTYLIIRWQVQPLISIFAICQTLMLMHFVFLLHVFVYCFYSPFLQTFNNVIYCTEEYCHVCHAVPRR